MTDRKRKSWMFWVLDDDHMPVEARGYECPPNDDIWWFPSLGYSMSGVYPSKEDAADASRKKLTALAKAVNERLSRLGDAPGKDNP